MERVEDGLQVPVCWDFGENLYVSGEMKYIYQFCANTHWDWLPFDIYEQT